MQEFIDFLGRNPVLSVAWAGLFIALIVTTIKAATSKVKSIRYQEAVQLINKQSAKVVDIRGRDDYKKGHIVDAIHVAMADIKNKRLGALEKMKQDPIILVCNAGMTSSQAAQLLSQQGFETVYSLHGGMSDWTANNMPVARKKR
ncbi:rhodanese-like domain-containing protein [Paraferrimonas sedimenticola]|uniref:Rhodanese-like domain-containing protein n=1 Tax=Paraferrimonas sedimenticola TaxID=375674 RepID=A0AA37RYR6_9GAMM|nr:rhodanese-like domain-containing protein [Paraferrimonas sedimenticola]GLP97774.1 rhodanese-like domain-containing protein [Paraferrimonas sedimenticola]